MEVGQVVFIPSEGAGHQVAALEFAHRLLKLENRFFITILNIPSPFAPPAKDPETSINDSMRCINLPLVEDLPPQEYIKEAPETFHTAYMDSYVPQVRKEIHKLVNATGESYIPVAGLVVDMFCSSMLIVGQEFNIPCYTFFTCSVGFLALMDYIPDHHAKFNRHFSPTDPDAIIPSFQKPFPSEFMPPFLLRETGYTTFLHHANRMRQMTGIIANSFAKLEPRALFSLQNRHFPSIYTVGPVIDVEGQAHSGRINPDQHDRIMTWLDAQPKSSVVFLCFGSLGYLRENQLKEVAVGLVKSGARFLWSFRKPGQSGQPEDYSGEEISRIVSSDFMDVIKGGNGMICGWAPQVEVLAHWAVMGFVTHCGWNSVLESVYFGRPIVTWPMYGEQQFNAVEVVEELGLGVELRLSYGGDAGDLVVAEEVERAIKALVSDEGRGVRERARVVGEMSRRVLMDGGSSSDALKRFVDDVMGFVQ